MFLAEVLGFWLLVGVMFFGWKRLSEGKGVRVASVVPRSNRRGA